MIEKHEFLLKGEILGLSVNETFDSADRAKTRMDEIGAAANDFLEVLDRPHRLTADVRFEVDTEGSFLRDSCGHSPFALTISMRPALRAGADQSLGGIPRDQAKPTIERR